VAALAVLLAVSLACPTLAQERARPSSRFMAAPKAAKVKTMEKTIDETTGLPESLRSEKPLWESIQSGTAHRDSTATRLYRNGELYSWSNSKRVVRDGKPSRERAPYAWRLDAKVSAQGVHEVTDLINGSFRTAESPATRGGDDASFITWRSCTDHEEHTIVTQSSAMDKQPEAIRKIQRAITSNIIPEAVPIEQA